MLKQFLTFVVIGVFYFLINTSFVFADIGPGLPCTPGGERCASVGTDGYSCQRAKSPPPDYICQPDSVAGTFGQIKPPDALTKFIGGDPSGAKGINQFLTNLVRLIYSLAFIVLIFMILWGAWDWMTSEGDKEKLESAKRKLINAFIGMLIFGVAFAAIQVLGTFTGFKFFVGQK